MVVADNLCINFDISPDHNMSHNSSAKIGNWWEVAAAADNLCTVVVKVKLLAHDSPL